MSVDDELSRAARELIETVSAGPSAEELRLRLHRRRRHQVVTGAGLGGLAIAIAGLAYVSLEEPQRVFTAGRAAVEETVGSSPVSVSPPSDQASGCESMPDLIGKTEVEALASVARVADTWEVGEQQVLDGALGVVVNQRPGPGEDLCSVTEPPRIILSVAAYVVVAGDTYQSIAADHDVGLAALLAANDISGNSTANPGDQLIIPGANGSSTGGEVFATVPTSVP